ncbi:TRPM8 channel-associated factor 2-like [Dromiciops gliroides]|uniref:TRPM8 channel-associated factor 2-like n=1 Tax=Dromiciops gliroides TaxID=33562 RepID=UPI001CC5479D|nr:TRPM8 channel-associated factor 2-like [Dromiciops gliroides]
MQVFIITLATSSRDVIALESPWSIVATLEIRIRILARKSPDRDKGKGKRGMETNLSNDFECLVKGLNAWELPSDLIPSELLLISETSFPVLVNKNDQVLIAASHYGQGRIVVLSHEGYLQDAKMAPFLRNAVEWLGQCEKCTVGVHKSVEGLASILCDTGIEAQSVDHFQDSLKVFCIDAFDNTYAKQLVQFLKNGGGLLIGGQPWQWAKKNDHKVLTNFPGNHVTSVAGIYFTETQADTSSLKFSEKIPEMSPAVKFGEDISEDQRQLLDGIIVMEIKDCGVPSNLLVHGPLAFPLALNDHLSCTVAGARYGQGRVIVLSHEGLLFSPKFHQFLINAIRWLKGDQRGKIGVTSECERLFHRLTRDGMNCSLENHLTTDLSVYCCTIYNDSQAKQRLEFVAEGGGLLIGGQSWSWFYNNPNKCVLTDFASNHLLNSFGISMLGEHLRNGTYYPTGLRSYHFRLAMVQFLEMVKNKTGKLPWKWQEKLIKDYSAFLLLSTGKTPIYDSIHQILKKVIKTTQLPVVNSKNPLFKDSSDRILLHVASELACVKPDFASEIYRLGYRSSIPCLCAPASSMNMEMDLSSQSGNIWKSTGLYLHPGCTLNITIPHSACSSNVKVQIGCHSDNLNGHDKTIRAPVVIYQHFLNKPNNSISSLWGGLVYIIVPNGCSLGNTSITFTGAVPAPYFVLGKTSVEEWKNSIRHHPVPWGELQADSVILTVPAENLQRLENPEPLLRLWNEITEAIARLGGKANPFPRHERIVTDVQISQGWMHSGYPIMGHLDIVNALLSEHNIRKYGLWGPLHEMGHNQQRNDLEFPPHTTEATCNIWTVYVHETVLNISRNDTHPALRPKERQNRLKDYQTKGASLSRWYGWTALETYLQLQEAFGWESLTEVFKTFQHMSGVPKDNESKMNMWVTKFSEQVQKNLAPFFKAWGWPVHKEVANAVSYLPEWKENPMKIYCQEN